ncbi:MAG TPA: DMT family transporter [Clostridia bacterium]|nr:DMT family transporter [Clostridia bacterium]
MKLYNSFHPYAFLTIFFWSLGFVLTRLALQYFSPFSLGFLRYFAASCTMLVIVLSLKLKVPKWTDVKWFLVAGFFGFFICMIAFNKGCETTTAATGSVIIAIAPVITALLARVFYHEKLGVYKWTATVIEFMGVTVLTLMNSTFSLNPGLLWLLLTAFSLGVYNLLQRKLTKSYSGIQASSYSIFAGTAMLVIFSVSATKEASGAPPLQLLYVLILGVFCGAIAFAAWAQAFKKAKRIVSVSNYMFITPFLTALLGFALAGELPDLPTIAGGIIILTGMAIFNFGDRLYEYYSQQKKREEIKCIE